MDTMNCSVAAWVSHELRTQLSYLVAPLDRVEQRFTNDPIVTDQLGTVRAYIDAVARLGDALLDDEAIAGGTFEAFPSPTDPLELAEEVVGRLRPIAAEHGIAFRLDADGLTREEISIDRGRTSRVLAALAETALRRTAPPGMVVLRVERHGSGLRGTVEYQNSGQSQQQELGCPLLQSARKLVTTLGGQLQQHDQIGKNRTIAATFPECKARESAPEVPAFYIPIPKPINPAAAPAFQSEDPQAPTVVVVEDEAHILRIYVATLKRRFTVYTASNGLEALPIIRRVRPQLVMTDHMMPTMTGAELLREMHADETTRRIPVMVVTAMATPELRDALKSHQASELLIKPVRPIDLLERADAVMEKGAQARQREARAQLDPLTETLCRSALLDRLRLYLKRGDAACLIMVDIDHFSQVNDLYGRRIGDQALVETAKAVSGAVREDDMVARWDGDSFAVLLTHINDAEAQSIANRVVQAVGQVRVDDGGASSGIVTVRLRASAGITATRPDELAEDTVDRVNEALRRAQVRGLGGVQRAA